MNTVLAMIYIRAFALLFAHTKFPCKYLVVSRTLQMELYDAEQHLTFSAKTT